jgi:hypothetical protein
MLLGLYRIWLPARARTFSHSLGHQRTWRNLRVKSASPPITDIDQRFMQGAGRPVDGTAVGHCDTIR